MTIEQLEDQFKQYENVSAHLNDLYEKQEEMLGEMLEESEPLIEWYQKKNLYFTHPDIRQHTSRGPIMGYDEASDELIVYNSQNEFIRLSLNNKEEKPMKLGDIMEEGYFESAMDGLLYLQSMMGHYLGEIEKTNAELEGQLAKYTGWNSK